MREELAWYARAMQQAQAVKTFYTDNDKRKRVGNTIREYMGFFDESNGGGVEAPGATRPYAGSGTSEAPPAATRTTAAPLNRP